MKFILTILLVLCAVVASAQNTNTSSRRPLPVKGVEEVSVLLVEKHSRDQRNAVALDALVKQYHSSKPHHYKFGNWARIELKNKDLKVFENKGKREKVFKRVVFAQECQTIAFPADPLAPQQWGLAKVQATNAWTISAGSSNVIVGVVDTGVFYSHPDLVSQFYFDSVDQAYGYTATNGVLAIGGEDDHGHGSHCAGIVAAKANNGIGITGVAPGVRLMSFKFLKANGAGWDSDFALLADKIIELRGRGVPIVVLNHSWGGGGSEILKDVFQALEDAGVLSVCAAGNSGLSLDLSDVAPAGLPVASIVAVAASDTTDAKAGFSNYGLAVEVAAPGVGILSTVPFFGTSISDSNGYAFLSGTSMACPHVAALAAIVRSLRPEFSPLQVRSVICNKNSYDLVNPRFTATGRINCFKTVQHALVASGNPNHPPIITQWTRDTILRAGDILDYSFTATDPDGDLLEHQIVSTFRNVPTNQASLKIPEYVRPTYYFAKAAVVDGNGGYDWKLTHIDALTNGSVYPPFNVTSANVTKAGSSYSANVCASNHRRWIYDATTWVVDGSPYINRSTVTTGSCNVVNFPLSNYNPEHLTEIKALNDLGQWASPTNRFYFNGAGPVAVPTNHFPKLVIQTDVDWGVAPLTVHWNIADSYDVDGTIEHYWHMEENEWFIYLTVGPTSGEFTFKEPGRHFLEFMVRDNHKGMHYDYKEINVLHARTTPPRNLRIER